MAMADGRKRRNELYIYITNNKKEERDSKNHFKVVRINESKEKRERERERGGLRAMRTMATMKDKMKT